VRVRSVEEIARTLDVRGKHRGLWFDQDMLKYCGGTYRVRGPVGHIIDGTTGRLRLMNSEGVSLRINVDDGKATVDGSHKFKDGDANAGRTARIVAGAYTNSFKDTKATTLYNIDAATGTLVTQAPPNDGILNTVGSLGIPVTGAVAFNIVSSGPDQNAGWLVAGGSLYSVDLKTGKATMAGKISGLNGTLTDIAWMN
jgi:hypothetical protein